MRVNIHGLIDTEKCYEMVRELRWGGNIDCPHCRAPEMVKKYKSPAENPMPVKSSPKSKRVNPATSDRHYSLDEVEFMNALANFKQASGRLFPSCSEILDILRKLGYEKVGSING